VNFKNVNEKSQSRVKVPLMTTTLSIENNLLSPVALVTRLRFAVTHYSIIVGQRCRCLSFLFLALCREVSTRSYLGAEYFCVVLYLKETRVCL
jgi:hypothetical protein